MEQARAVIFTAEQQVTVGTVPLPQRRADELLVRCTLSGISIGTERWALIGSRPETKFPMLTGYLGVGVVEEAGSEATGFAVGDRVFYSTARWDEPYGSHSWMGTHASHAVVPTKMGDDWPPYVCKVPAGVDDASAAMAGLMAVAVQGADMLRVTSKDTAFVLGVGMIGQCAAQVLAARGARVIVADKTSRRVELALGHGASAGVTLVDGPIAQQLADVLPAGGADIVIDTTSVAPVVQQLAPLVKHRGQILLQGYYPGLTPMSLDVLSGRRPTIHMPCSMDLKSHEYAMNLVAGGFAKLAPLVTHRFPAERAPEAYRLVLAPPADLLGIVIDW